MAPRIADTRPAPGVEAARDASPLLVAPRDSRETSRARWLEWGPVPPAVRDFAVGRLRAMTLLVMGLLIAFGTLTVVAARRSYIEQAVHTYGSPAMRLLPPVLSLGMMIVSLSLRGYALRATDKRRVLDLAIVYEVMVALALGLLHHLHTWHGFWIYTGWSHVAVMTIVFAVIIPATPGRVLAASIAAAAMDPLALSLTVWAGAPWPTGAVLAMLLVPDLFAVVFAYFIATIVHRLGTQLETAERLGSYRLIERLGKGGMGEVWRAEHHTLARAAAIKLIRADALGDDVGTLGAAAQRFEREAQATALLCSPHTITVYDFGQARDGSFYYVMELLDGVDLERCIERFGPMAAERVVYLLRQACHSLAEAHARGLVHRDVKPANMYLCRYGLDHDRLKVLDFGLVKPTTEGALADAKLTQQGQIQGTPTYLAPEQILGTETVDGRADLYALGCVAHWLLTGRTVFSAKTTLGQLFAHKGQAPESMSRHVAVPPELDAIVLRCLAKDPAARYASAGDVDKALAQVPLASPWAEERARAWWDEHLPAGAPRNSGDVSLAPTMRADSLADTASASPPTSPSGPADA